MTTAEFDRIVAWNREHPDEHYSPLGSRARYNLKRGKPGKYPLVPWIIAWFFLSIWRIISLLIGLAAIIFVLWLLSKTGPGCTGTPDQCVY